MTEEDAFAHVTPTETGAHVDFFTSDGAERVTFGGGSGSEPGDLSSSVLADGVLYGPATFDDCIAALDRLSCEAQAGVTSSLVERETVVDRRPFADLERLYDAEG